MTPHDAWPWSESLGAVRADHAQILRVRRILFGMVRDRCHDLGLDEGTEFRCRGRTADGVAVELCGTGIRSLEFSYAWFVQVEPVGEVNPPVVSELGI